MMITPEILETNAWLLEHGAVVGQVFDDRKLANLMRERGGLPPIGSKTPIPDEGPGTELKTLVATLGLQASSNCQCAARMRQMNVWGVEGCERNRQTILAWLVESYKGLDFRGKVKAILKGAASPLAFTLNPLRPVESLLDEAIRRASPRSRE